MERLSKKTLVGALALCFGIAVGCGGDAGTAGSGSATSKASGSAKASTTSSNKASTTPSGSANAGGSASAAATPAPSGSASAGAGQASVNVDDLMKEDAKEDKGVLNVDLSKADDSAPSLGGDDNKPPEPKSGTLEWLPAGNLLIPNPGWKKKSEGEMGFLEAPDTKGGMLFTHFKTPEEGLKKVDELTAKMGLKNLKWHKPEQVTIGPNKLPGFVGVGHGEDEKGEGGKLFYALVKTGEPDNLLALGGADDKGGDDDFKVAIDIIDNIKKK